MASITPYGQSGPYRDYKSSELVAGAAGGQAYVCGEPDKPPLTAHRSPGLLFWPVSLPPTAYS